MPPISYTLVGDFCHSHNWHKRLSLVIALLGDLLAQVGHRPEDGQFVFLQIITKAVRRTTLAYLNIKHTVMPRILVFNFLPMRQVPRIVVQCEFSFHWLFMSIIIILGRSFLTIPSSSISEAMSPQPSMNARIFYVVILAAALDRPVV